MPSRGHRKNGKNDKTHIKNIHSGSHRNNSNF